MSTTDMRTGESTYAGGHGQIFVREWSAADPSHVVLLAHGVSEHSGRYDHVGRALAEAGAAVYAPDHMGHGQSEGEPALVDDVDDLVADLHLLADRAREEHPGLPIVLLGHSMGGLVVARFVQLHRDELAAVVLSSPPIGGNPDIETALAVDPLPDIPIDPAVLSRDPEVGRAYAADPLVYSGPFKRTTLEALFASINTIVDGPPFGDLPLLWIHGTDDALAPCELTRPEIERLGGGNAAVRVYEEGRHEMLNEINQDEVIGELTRFVGAVAGSR